MYNILNNFNDFLYSKRSHFDYFRAKQYDIDLFKEPFDIDNCDLKKYQDLLIFAFIKENIPSGSKILDIGGGNSRIMKYFKEENECWNLDKLDGIGFGPTEIETVGYRLVKDYIGGFSKELPDNYFDFVFSISTLEHIPRDNPILFENILIDINRVLKRECYSLHAVDCVLRIDLRCANKLLQYLFNNATPICNFVQFDEIINDKDFYTLSEKYYESRWRFKTKKSYQEFGMPFSYNILWKKAGIY